MRLFFAILPPGHVLDVLSDAQESLRRISGGRFTRRERLHLTLRFLGEADLRGLAAAEALLRAAALQTPPLELCLGGLGA